MNSWVDWVFEGFSVLDYVTPFFKNHVQPGQVKDTVN